MTNIPKKCADDTNAIEEQNSFILTKEYRRFAEFCDACRREKYKRIAPTQTPRTIIWGKTSEAVTRGNLA